MPPAELTLVAISDTHACHDDIVVPPGDILIHGGDLTRHGSLEDVRSFDRWLGTLPHRHKVVIAGNHDFCFERDPQRARPLITNAIYLQDEGVTVEGLRLYGSPWQPWFYDWAFNLERGAPLAEKWALIPDDTDIVVTHGPPYGHGDRTYDGRLVGCRELARRLQEIEPAYHICGHIHEGYGLSRLGPTVCLNASVCDLSYRPVQPAIVVQWPPEPGSVTQVLHRPTP